MEQLQSELPQHVYNKLIDGKIDSLKTIICMNVSEIEQLTKLSHEEATFVQSEAVALITRNKFTTVFNLLDNARLSTGCNSINNLLKGGIPSGAITEIVGKSSCGKTQFCLQLLITAQYPVINGGLNAGSVYISTETAFPSKRLHQLCENVQQRLGQLENGNILNNIFVEHIADYEQLRRCIYVRLPKLLDQKYIKLLIIDSIAGIWRHENKDINYYERSVNILHISKQLNNLAFKHNIAVVCVNQVMDDINTGQTEPCLGLTWSNVIQNRLFLTRHNSSIRKATVKFSPDLPHDSCTFSITIGGIVDSI